LLSDQRVSDSKNIMKSKRFLTKIEAVLATTYGRSRIPVNMLRNLRIEFSKKFKYYLKLL